MVNNKSKLIFLIIEKFLTYIFYTFVKILTAHDVIYVTPPNDKGGYNVIVHETIIVFVFSFFL